MVQKILRTMQDDLREAKENKAGKNSQEIKTKETRKFKEPETPEQENSTIKPIVKNPVPEQSERKVIAPEALSPVLAVETQNAPTDEIQNDLEEIVPKKQAIESNQAKEIIPPKQVDNSLISKQQTKDAELSTLIKRVSASMEKTTPQIKEKPQEIRKPDKDQELKELIERMSKNMEKEEKILQKEKTNTSKSEQSDSSKNPARSFLKNIFHKDEEDKEKDNQQKPQDAYWEKMHKTLKDSQNNASEKKIEEIKKESIMKPKEEAKKDVIVKPAKIIEPVTQEATPIIPEKPKNPEPAKEETIKTTEKAKIEETGIIAPIKKDEPIVKKTNKEPGNIIGYVAPENRLIFGKQEYYSSLRKKVDLKTGEKSLDDMEKTLKQEEKKLSDEEEKKMLRHQIVKKYKIKFFELPIAKIIIFAILFLGTIAAGLFFILPKVAPIDEDPVTLATGENIAEIDQKISKEVFAKEKDIAAPNYFDDGLDPWKSYNNGDIIELKINYDDYEVMLPRDEALKAVLGEEQFKNIQEDFINSISQKYSIVAFKTENGLRIGIVLKYDQSQEEKFRSVMMDWEGTDTRSKKIYNVMKTLFTSSKIIEGNVTSFQPAIYSNTELRYINLPDTETSMDYVIYEDFIFFTTSKDTTFQMIDLIKG